MDTGISIILGCGLIASAIIMAPRITPIGRYQISTDPLTFTDTQKGITYFSNGHIFDFSNIENITIPKKIKRISQLLSDYKRTQEIQLELLKIKIEEEKANERTNSDNKFSADELLKRRERSLKRDSLQKELQELESLLGINR